jgi:hypothetical protein
VGGGGEFWLGESFGLGLEGAALTQGELFGDSTSAQFLAASVALRSAPGPGYFVLILGAGPARATHIETSGSSELCLGILGQRCTPATESNYTTFVADLALGFLAHPGRSLFEIGPVARFDLIGGTSPAFLMTINLELGIAVPRRAPRADE